jgi:DNA-directed RNA polymerase subunit RPC12/RpoP
MGERKVLNKYYPPDFDPTKLPRGRRPKNNQFTVRMMLPMSVRCNTCGEYLYKGKKFNSKKETVWGEEYLGIRIFRFYMKCTNCAAEFTIKTDPKNSDYIAEMNCSRNFEPWRENEKLIEEIKKARQKEEEGDAMKALENRTLDSKIEMDIIEALDEIRALNARNAKVTSDTLLDLHKRTYEDMQKSLEAEDEETVKGVNFKSSANFVKRLEDEEQPAPKIAKPAEKTDFIKVLPLPKTDAAPKKKTAPLIKLVPNGKKAPGSTGVVIKPVKQDKPKEQQNSGFSLVDYD